METIIKSVVNATPRSDKYYYYDSGTTSYTSNKSPSQVGGNNDDGIIYPVTTQAQLPTTGSDRYLYVVEETQQLFIWDEENS
jgi:hypothetical protein